MSTALISMPEAEQFFKNDKVLREYQKEACIAFCNTFNSEITNPTGPVPNSLLVLATGGGKTLVAMKLVEYICVNLKMRVLWMVHRRELVKQAAETIRRLSPHMKITYWDAKDKDSSGRLVFAMMLSTRGRFECEEEFDLVIVDEAHKVHGNNTYQITLGGNEDSETHVLKYRFLLGLTATPIDPLERLAIHFTNICYQKTFLELMSEGYLAKINYIRFKTNIPMEEQIKYVGNGEKDFTLDSLKELDNEKRNNIIVDEYIAHRSTYGKSIMFAIDVNHGQELCRLLNEKESSINAQLITGATKNAERDAILQQFKDGVVQVLVNIEVFIEGFDEPSIQSVFLCRPTLSKRIFCLSPDTEVLTRDGWKNDARKGEDVLVFDPITEEARFEPVLEKIRRPLYEDEYFVSMTGQSIDTCVTNKHDMLVRNRKKKQTWFKEKAELFVDRKESRDLPAAGYLNTKGIPLSDSELMFLGWYLSDGYLNKSTNSIMISQADNSPYVSEIEETLSGCGFRYGRLHRSKESRNSQNGTFHSENGLYVWNVSKGMPRKKATEGTGWQKLEPYIDRNFAESLMQMSREQFGVFLTALHHGDGSKQSTQSWTKGSYDIHLEHKMQADRLQVLAITHGYRANVSIQSTGRKNPYYIVHIKDQNFHNYGERNDTINKRVLTGRFGFKETWCVTTPTGTIFTRRNGKCLVVGNCQSIGRGSRVIKGQKEEFYVVDFVDLSDYYAYACEEWSVKLYGAKEDESLNGRRQELKHEDRIVRVVERLVEAEFNPQIRRRIEKEMLNINGIIKVGNNKGETRRFLITNKQHAILGDLYDSVDYWSKQSSDKQIDMDKFIPITFQKLCKAEKEKAATFNVSQWRSICWGIYRKYVRGYDCIYGHPETPSFEYTDLTPFINEVKASEPEVCLAKPKRRKAKTT